jgi:AcrR family transcriptional regulator
MPAITSERRSARERLLAAADELFYAEGVHSVGIDRVIEQAGVAKASLYSTFGSKEGLVLAYLSARHEARTARITRAIDRYDTPRERLLAVFDAQAEVIADPTFRGCAFQRASSERSGAAVTEACDTYRGWVRQLFQQLCEDAGLAEPRVLAEQLVLLYDGATVAAQMDHRTKAAASAKVAAEALIEAASPTKTRHGRSRAR